MSVVEADKQGSKLTCLNKGKLQVWRMLSIIEDLMEAVLIITQSINDWVFRGLSYVSCGTENWSKHEGIATSKFYLN